MTRERRLIVAISLNVVIVVVQVVAGVVAGSLGLLADAGHNLADVAAIVVSLVAVRLARRPATPQRSFGWHRSTILAAQANAVGILVVTALIAIEGVRRLLDPEPVDAGVVIVAAALGLVANAGAALVLHRDHGDDLNMRSALLHTVSDAAASAGVIVAGVIMALTSWYWVDPLVSLAIAAVIAARGVRLLGETASVLLESTPPGVDPLVLAAAMAGVEGVESVHDLHVWSLSSELRALAAHLVLDGHPTLEEAQVVGDRVRRHVSTRFAIGHATLELECEACSEPEEDPCGVDAHAVEAGLRGPNVEAGLRGPNAQAGHGHAHGH
jgi:cobalt-zinc-cadmium efflux system protein